MITVLIAGIGGASLGTEIAKSLRLAGGYRIIGCDPSPLAFGHYSDLCDKTVRVSLDRYIDHVVEISREEHVQVIVPGAEEPMRLITAAADRFSRGGIRLAMNSQDVVIRLADKERCFIELQRLGIAIPRTVAATEPTMLDQVPFPCVIKPSVESGGSSSVFFARNREEADVYATYLNVAGKRPIAQEYIAHTDGEFTVGALSGPDGMVLGVIAMERAFPAKLSIASKGHDFLISSGFSQGHFDEYPSICATARTIARAVGSVGPLNIQGRVDKTGRFLPFEINPRFSATTYLRALAGFNEVNHFIRRLVGEEAPPLGLSRPGWYLRSLTEVAVPEGKLLS
jgi:carbamoyl-phosphate synthase large subunit